MVRRLVLFAFLRSSRLSSEANRLPRTVEEHYTHSTTNRHDLDLDPDWKGGLGDIKRVFDWVGDEDGQSMCNECSKYPQIVS